MENLKYIPFNQVNFSDVFFDSLKADYSHGFIEWFHSKCNSNDYAYVLYDENDNIDGFLYLKTETGIIDDVSPIIPNGIHLKVGTFKFNPKGTLRGQRFLKKIFDHALNNNVDNIYVTAFEKHDYLIRLFKIYGFIDEGVKVSENGIERVLIKEMNRDALTGDILSDYPFINNRSNEGKFLLSIYPTFHTRLFPDSKLITESPDVISDVSYANSIRKVYICGMSGVELMKPNDIIIIYRTSDNQGPAYYRSVATSLCVVEKVRNIHSFVTEKEFLDYCARYSVFTESELKNFYKTKKYPYIISFTYNLALPKRLNRAKLISEIGLNPQAYWGVMKLTNEQFNNVVKLGGVNESIIIN
ncbi:TPA: N-acetyltransferase [Enterobacter cloacae]|uniref:N-acetyltransferase n=1 Tax=Enterobacter cloacae TaxID=550 RepID=UPI001FF4BFE6|nr:N-acetyltransferase [Enterobacter cloacae]MCK1070699.1 N-acetyltransferase [Enterobacter cloacae subsp. cloacae]HCE8676496.1 N-acetyltransferase [Enterobacter cloacae]HCE9222264.1 N-acetyltransferase [Enterobacter cloacae]HDS4421379.1 N-acetyltransferase [Enterobacter cloacae]HDT2153632.1 N-acetyltransferase [Enterobacter cloacae]